MKTKISLQELFYNRMTGILDGHDSENIKMDKIKDEIKENIDDLQSRLPGNNIIDMHQEEKNRFIAESVLLGFILNLRHYNDDLMEICNDVFMLIRSILGS